MSKEKIDEIVEVKDDFLKNYPNWRKGQALFNAIFYIDQDVGNKIRGSQIDPFHRDDMIDKCMDFLQSA